MPEAAELSTVGQALPGEEERSAALRLRTYHRPYLVGIAGTGMSSLATLLAGMGMSVAGSDAGGAATLTRLASRGMRVYPGHAAEQLDDCDLVIRSAAIPPDNPELQAAHERQIPVLTHAQALGVIMSWYQGIGVAGTHGKSTTTALIAHVLDVAGRDPSLVGGAELVDTGEGSRLGNGPELVAEADEFDRRFLELHPEIAVITGIEEDHLDCFRDLADILQTFELFVAGIKEDGVVVTCVDEPNLDSLDLPRPRIRYGWRSGADWQMLDFAPIIGGGCRFEARGPGGLSGCYRLLLSGRHNAANALAAVAVASFLDVPSDIIRQGLATFRGTRRRFETRLRTEDRWIVDDYAHHPTEIRATLSAAREVHLGEIWAVFQPHTMNRTMALMDELATAFGDADHVIVTPIFSPAGRNDDFDLGVTSEDLVARMCHRDARAVDSLNVAVEALERRLIGGEMVLVLGAGDVKTVADRLAGQTVMGEAGAGIR